MSAKHVNGVRGSERGVALFIAIFTLLLITAIAAGMIMLTQTDTTISANFRDEQTAFFAAKAGVEEVRDRLRTNAVNGATNISLSSQLPGFTTPNSAPPIPGQPNGVLYVTNPLNGESDTPWVTNGSAYPDDEICTEASYMGTNVACTGNPPRPQPGSGGWYVTASSNSLYAASPVQPWKWVRVTVKTNQTSSGTTTASTVDGNTSDNAQLVCWDGTNEFTISSSYASCAVAGAAQTPAQNWVPVYVLTALAVTPSGSRRMVQMGVATDTIPAIPGALVMDGDSPSFGPGSSNAFSATGMDQSSSTNTLRPQNGTTCPPAGNEPAVGAYDTASSTTINASFGTGSSSRSGNYTGSPAGVSDVNTSLGSGGMNTVQGLNAMVNMVTSGAVSPNIYTTASSLTNPGTATNPVVNVVTGDATLTNFTGAGILLVEGTLTFSGKPNYDGVILVIGKGNLQFTGGGNGVIDGAVLVANLYDSLGNLIASGPPGIPTIGFSGGGSMTVQYDSCWVAAMDQASPYKSLGVRELAY
jgi:Tfp pilus assembly protein PilX